MRRAVPLRPARAFTCLLALMVLAGCSFNLSQLSFRVDDRLEFVTPESRALVTEPLTVSWTIRDFSIQEPGSAPPSRDAGYFAIFVDRPPVKPGQTLEAVVGDDQACKRDPKCPDRQYLADRQVYYTTKTSIRIDQVFPLTDTGDDTQLHDVIVVILDTSGRRIGESAWHRAFKLEKRSLS